MRNFDEEYQIMLNKLKMICKQKNMTQYALAKATGMSISSISNLMKGETRPYIYTLLMICDALNISLGELITDVGSLENDEDEGWLIRNYRCLSPEKRRMLKVYVDMLMQYNGKI